MKDPAVSIREYTGDRGGYDEWEELQLLLTLEGFQVNLIQKINYGWNTEFHKPPRWLKDPYPWDWMCTARKKIN